MEGFHTKNTDQLFSSSVEKPKSSTRRKFLSWLLHSGKDDLGKTSGQKKVAPFGWFRDGGRQRKVSPTAPALGLAACRPHEGHAGGQLVVGGRNLNILVLLSPLISVFFLTVYLF